MLPFGSYVSNNHHDKLLLYTLLPLGLSCVLLTVYAVLRKSKTEKLKNIADSAFGSFLSINSFLLPMLTTLIFSMFPCKLFEAAADEGLEHRLRHRRARELQVVREGYGRAVSAREYVLLERIIYSRSPSSSPINPRSPLIHSHSRSYRS